MDENHGVWLTIEDEETMRKFVRGAVKAGYMRRFDLRILVEWMHRTKYPIQVPVNLDTVIGVGQNTVVKTIFGKNIEATLTKCFLEAMMNKGAKKE